MKQAPVYFENGAEQLNSFVEENLDKKFFFLVDENTHDYCLPLLLADIEDVVDSEIIEIPDGEEAKSVEVAVQVWETLSELGADRQSILVNCGGGVVTDFGGFVASTFKRGIRFVNVPTSLLSMVDASVGGKTGINLHHLKNQIGTFAQPEMTWINPAFLSTLPEKELLSGFAEMLKHGLIRDRELWSGLAQLDELSAENFGVFIKRAVEIKQSIVALDPTEKGLRKILNAGHTLGHALESWFLDQQKDITHGSAVAAGLVLESFVSWQHGNLAQEDFDEIWSVISKFFPKLEIPEFEGVKSYLKHDKKNVGNETNFVVISEIGNCSEELQSFDNEMVKAAIEFYRASY